MGTRFEPFETGAQPYLPTVIDPTVSRANREETRRMGFVNHNLKERLRNFWDLQQEYWDMLSAPSSAEAEIRKKAASYLPRGGAVLDVACGTAANSGFLKNDCQYVGVDLSIKALQQPVVAGLEIVCADTDQLPFPENYFGGALATYVLEHAVDPVHTVREVWRVVKPGGRIVFMGPAWDLPFAVPNSLLSKSGSFWWRFFYAAGRFRRQLLGWWFGILPFEQVTDPDAFHFKFIYDSDAVYIVWSYELIRKMKQWGCKLVYWEVDDPMLGTNSVVRAFKRFLMLFPIYRYSGGTVLLVFEK
jgi:SAM-dependent methyltransferase